MKVSDYLRAAFDQESLDRDALDQEVPHKRQTTGYTCGAAALRQVLAFYGIDVDEKTLIKKLGSTPKDGTHPQNIVKVAKNYGLKAEILEGLKLKQVKGLLDKNRPFIAMVQWASDAKDMSDVWQEGHYVVVQSVSKQGIVLVDPATDDKTHTLSPKIFLTRWHDVESDGRKFIHAGIVFDWKKVE
jgi:ABC-type bacteriocin/lantibiotic exporter with double-glycine peptidase domain